MPATAEELVKKLNEMSDEHTKLGELRTQRWEEFLDTERRTGTYPHREQELNDLDEKMSTLFMEMLQVGKQVEEAEQVEKNRFRRPDKGLLGLLAKPLPMPDKNLQRIHAQDDQFDKIKTSNSLAVTCYFVVILSVLGLAWVLPWLRYSPLSLLFSFMPTGGSTQVESLYANIPVAAAILFILYMFINEQKNVNTFIRNAALQEEQLFRRGAEHWSWPQRVYSCMAFGIVHVFNLFVPFAVVICLCGAGALLMWVYLREYRTSGDEHRATIMATKIHATYNRVAVFVVIALITAILAYTGISFCLSIMS